MSDASSGSAEFEAGLARQRAGAELATRLIGLQKDDAVAEAIRVGFAIEVCGPVVSADLDFNRIRIMADDDGVVRAAGAG